jgi:hypothetical protein
LSYEPRFEGHVCCISKRLAFHEILDRKRRNGQIAEHGKRLLAFLND